MNRPFSEGRGTESGTLAADSTPVDPDLAEIASAWPTLPDAIKAGVMAMVKAAAAKGADK